MGKVHIGKDGKIKPCGATARPCHLGAENQFESAEKAESVVASREAIVNDALTSWSRKGSRDRSMGHGGFNGHGGVSRIAHGNHISSGGHGGAPSIGHGNVSPSYGGHGAR